MPTINATTLTLTTVNQDTTITVTYNAVFNTLERNLVGMGMSFHSHEDVEGVDGGVGTLITSMPTFVFPVTVGVGSQVIARSVSKTVTRASLQEDPAAGDNDEIRCKIRIHASPVLPPEFTPDVFTPQQILLG